MQVRCLPFVLLSVCSLLSLAQADGPFSYASDALADLRDSVSDLKDTIFEGGDREGDQGVQFGEGGSFDLAASAATCADISKGKCSKCVQMPGCAYCKK